MEASFGRVAKRSNVTKGGLQYHFRSKQALLDTLFDGLFLDFEEQFEAAISAEPDTPGKNARAYVRLAFEQTDKPTQRAIMLLCLAWLRMSRLGT